MDNRKNPEYHVIAAIRKQKNHGQTMLKMSRWDQKRPTSPKILDSINTMMHRTANENVALCNWQLAKIWI